MQCYNPSCNNRVVRKCEGKSCKKSGCDEHIRVYMVNGKRKVLCGGCAMMTEVLGAKVTPSMFE